MRVRKFGSFRLKPKIHIQLLQAMVVLFSSLSITLMLATGRVTPWKKRDAVTKKMILAATEKVEMEHRIQGNSFADNCDSVLSIQIGRASCRERV